jgi:Ca2+-binding RTX toxin-like protein
VTGDKALTIGGTTGGALLTAVDASAATGAITLSTGAGPTLTGVAVTGPSAATAGLFTVTTSSGKDTVTTGAGNSVLDTGSGNDTITTGAGTTTVTPGTGNDALTLGAGVDTVRFAETGAADSDVITGFGTTDVMAFRLGQVTAAATTTTGATTLGAGIFGTLQTSATSPSLSNVNGVGTGTAIAFQAIAPNATATTGTVTGTSNVIALNGAYTDGTAAGVISALGSSAVEGIATTPTGKFLLVTYSVGNIAQVWSYAGDATVDTNITSTELSLVATLNGVAQNALTAANFATYLGAGSTVLTQSNAGQTVTVSTPLNIITTTANANGAYLTAGSDTINVNIGMLPTNIATTAMGLTVLDGSTSDSDTLNATVLGTNFYAGLLLSNIETVNLEQTVGGAAFDAAAVMPGTKNFGFTGTGNQAAISNLPASSTITFGAARTGAVIATQTTAGTFDVALNGSGVAATSLTAAPTAPSLSMVGGTNSTITVTGTSFLSSLAGVTTPFGNTATGTNTITGTGNLTLLGTGEMFTAHVGSVSSTYTGSLTLRPSNNTAFDLSGAGADAATGAFTGVKTIDLTAFATAETITLAAANGAWPVTVTSNNATGIGALTVSQAGSGTTDALTVTVTNAAANITSIAASSLETLIVNLGGTVGTTTTKSVGGITLATNAATQSVTVNSNAATTTLGTVTADSLNATGVAGIVTATLANGASGAVFTGPASTASYVIGNGLGEIITTGTANDAIYVATGTTGSANLTGGLGNDTYGFAHTTVNNSQITDTSGTDTLALITGGASNIAGLNSGASLVTSGIEQVVVVTSGVMSVATGQITGAVAYNTSAAGGVLAITQTTVGTTAAPAVLSLALATFPTFNYLDNAGTSTAGITLTGGGTLLIGSTGVDSITGSTLADTITGGTGADTLAGGSAADQFVYAASAAQLVTYAGADTTTANIERITDFTAAADSIRIVSGSLFAGITPTTTSGAGGASAGFTVNESVAGVLGAAPIAIAAGATSITALTALFETAAGGVLSTIGIAAAATGLQAYTFATAAGAGAFDGRVYLVINNATAALAADDVIVELTGITGNFAATNFSIS